MRQRPGMITPPQQSLHQVERAIDGDTIIVKSNGKIRYSGVNAPETHHPTRVWSFSGRKLKPPING
jgi:endonuclease YncB( thermonuclease family)